MRARPRGHESAVNAHAHVCQVGGYLGYVGYFCLAAGIGLGSSVEINTFSSWANLLSQGEWLTTMQPLALCADLVPSSALLCGSTQG